MFSDNAGVIAFDADLDAVCFKAETHNHPVPPSSPTAVKRHYGIGGCHSRYSGNRSGGQARCQYRSVFCVAFLINQNRTICPEASSIPAASFQQIVAGVRDYGNRMGIPTVNVAVYFDPARYIGNPLVFCGCVGLIPRNKIHKQTLPGDAIVVMGGRTGRDGIHGATFSSAELTDTHADEFSHAVQIGNAITEKQVSR